MTTVTASAYPRNDIRSMFNTATTTTITVPTSSKSKTSIVAVAPVKETKPPAKKVEKKAEIDHLCDAYCKIIKNGDAVYKDKVKEMLHRLVEHFKIRPKKLYRYFHYIKYNSGKKTALTLELLLQNPFEFISFQNQFISYKDAMNICQESGTFPELRVRIVAWIYDYFIGKQNKYYISENDSDKLLTEFLNEFSKEKLKAEQILFGILIEMKFGQKIFYTTHEFIEHEKRIGDMVIDLFYKDSDDDDHADDGGDDHEKIEQHIQAYIKKQNKDDFQFEPEQVEAIHKGCALKRGELFNITGPPGTGKSTIVNCIVNYKLDRNSSIAIMAPTGLAQKNLKNSCKYDSIHDKNKKIIFSTLHRAINFTFVVQKKQKEDAASTEPFEPFVPDMLIVDEASMVDLDLFFKLLKACKQFHTSLILIGDVNQLPPIGPGIPFESIINSKVFHTTRLTKIKRQDGNLREVIQKLNTPNGLASSDFDGESSIFIEAKTSDQIEKAVTEIYRHELERNPDADIHTMCAQKDKGVFHLNPVIQMLKNGKSVELFVKKYENGHQHRFYEGDLVMRTENDYKDENNVRVNGDVGTIHESRVKAKKFGRDVYEYRYTVKYIGGSDELNEETNLSVEDVRDAFVPFYASTVHKMQGLQKSTIVFIVSPEHSFCLTNENSKKLVYTAISRCKANFYVVGDKNLFVRSQQSKGTSVYPTQFMKKFNKYDFEMQ
jgi:ATP-dependent exoDNAse (exonuclease V) alpha subunit